MGRHPSVQGGCAAAPSPTPAPGAQGRGPQGHGCPLLPADRVQEELDRVLGPGRPPQPADQRALPYTNAVLHEVQRFITLLPHVPRCTAGSTRLGGYLLPKVGGQASGGDSGALMPGSHGGREGIRAAGRPPPPPCGLGFPVKWDGAASAGSTLGQPSRPAGPPRDPVGAPVQACGGTGTPARPLLSPAGHTGGPLAELRAPGQDAVGDPRPVQPGALPGRRRALREAGGLPALLCGCGCGASRGPRGRGPQVGTLGAGTSGAGISGGDLGGRGPRGLGTSPGLQTPPLAPWMGADAPASVSPQAAASAWERAWPGQSCFCSLLASSRASACSPRPVSAPLACAPCPRPPSPCGRRPRSCVQCPGPGGADGGGGGLACALGPGRGVCVCV